MVLFKYYVMVDSADILQHATAINRPKHQGKSFSEASMSAKRLFRKSLTKTLPKCQIEQWDIVECSQTQLLCGQLLLPRKPMGYAGLSTHIAAAIICIMNGKNKLARKIVALSCKRLTLPDLV